MAPSSSGHSTPLKVVKRTRIWYALLLLIMGVFLVRLFYMQVIRHAYYAAAATNSHLKEAEIPASRGIIGAHSGDGVVALALNQTFYTIYVDPTLVKDPDQVANVLSSVLKADAGDTKKKVQTADTRYVVLARKVSEQQKNDILGHKFPGIGAQAQPYRVYPDGALAAQVLGFVNNDGEGKYGIEQALDGKLAGTPGLLKAITDVNGVPLAANSGNTLTPAKSGDDVVLTIDVAMQRQLETILQQGLQNAKSKSGSALILDANTGAVKAIANWPTYDPTNYSATDNAADYANAAVSTPLEIGSVMKPLTAAAALNQGVIQPSTTFQDPSHYEIDGYTVRNIEEDGGPGTKSISDILNLSLNTGATWMLMQMGHSNNQITQQARDVWHDYMVNHYMFGKSTGIEQYEEPGYVPDPDKGYGLNLTYANTAFGQAMTATPLQLGAAFASIVNGGAYYKPHLVDYTVAADGTKTPTKPIVVKNNVVSPQVSTELRPMLENVVDHHSFARKFDQTAYSVGGKTGTAQIADKEHGGYLPNDYNGTYVGYVGGDTPQYIIVAESNDPKNGGYAGTAAAQPIFGNLAHMLLDNFNVTPKTH